MKYRVGQTVTALIGIPTRTGKITRSWWPYAEYAVQWQNGTKTNIDERHLSPVTLGFGEVFEKTHAERACVCIVSPQCPCDCHKRKL